MLSNHSEEDFYIIKEVNFGRLSPDGIPLFLWGSIIYSGTVMAVSAFATSYSVYITNPIWSTINKFNLIFFLVQLFFTIFFSNERNSFKFQRLQALTLSIISFKISIEAYQAFFLGCEDKFAPKYVSNTGYLLLLGGIIYIIISAIRGFLRVRKGEFRKEGKGLYNFKESKGYIILPIIYGFSILGGLVVKYISNISSMSSQIVELFFMLSIITTIQYGIAMAWPEFLLYTYCKFKFKSFEVPMPDRLKKKGANK
jgi:uncharacterized membrane protein